MRKSSIRAVLFVSTAALLLSTAANAVAATPVKTDTVSLSIKSDTEHGKKGTDGKWHDAYLPASASVHAGDRVVVTIRNYDSAPHTFTIAKLGINVVIKGGSAAHPLVKTFSFRAPAAGTYTWQCVDGCDPWAMTHLGYMKGRLTVRA
jgi:plastocyanin